MWIKMKEFTLSRAQANTFFVYLFYKCFLFLQQFKDDDGSYRHLSTSEDLINLIAKKQPIFRMIVNDVRKNLVIKSE